MNRTGSSAEILRSKPGLGPLLRSLGLDVSYHRAAGDFVYYDESAGNETEVLDLVGGYGTLLFGHNHPALLDEAVRFLQSGRPIHVQGSRRTRAVELAEKLSHRCERDDCVIFANSGTEAVEAALKHAMLETGGRTFIALEGAFHGKTLGAVQLAANPTFRDPFAISGLSIVRIRPDDIAQVERTFSAAHGLAGFIFEPILGEGGVRPLSPSFAQRVVDLCRSHNIPSIADECQTGLGRTGKILASHTLGIRPDYVILSKALGGGLAKISATLIDRNRYRRSFDLLHTSTFADDDFSCAIASKALELADDALLAQCRSRGEWLVDRLRGLQRSYPSVIADVRGRGLMLGVELREQSTSKSFLLRQLTVRQWLGWLVAGYLLKTHRIRIAPTLSAPFTLRLQPSALISQQSLEHFLQAMERTCMLVDQADVTQLTAHLPQQSNRGMSADDWIREEVWPNSSVLRFHP